MAGTRARAPALTTHTRHDDDDDVPPAFGDADAQLSISSRRSCVRAATLAATGSGGEHVRSETTRTPQTARDPCAAGALDTTNPSRPCPGLPTRRSWHAGCQWAYCPALSCLGSPHDSRRGESSLCRGQSPPPRAPPRSSGLLGRATRPPSAARARPSIDGREALRPRPPQLCTPGARGATGRLRSGAWFPRPPAVHGGRLSAAAATPEASAPPRRGAGSSCAAHLHLPPTPCPLPLTPSHYLRHVSPSPHPRSALHSQGTGSAEAGPGVAQRASPYGHAWAAPCEAPVLLAPWLPIWRCRPPPSWAQ
mmetsp:Transcript_20568/g.60741  ORF Transcript_20568/g.60741 Transcript_20568/m.60741 type:complete len:308 (-) Transcript_20568:145-1068(-)